MDPNQYYGSPPNYVPMQNAQQYYQPPMVNSRPPDPVPVPVAPQTNPMPQYNQPIANQQMPLPQYNQPQFPYGNSPNANFTPVSQSVPNIPQYTPPVMQNPVIPNPVNMVTPPVQPDYQYNQQGQPQFYQNQIPPNFTNPNPYVNMNTQGGADGVQPPQNVQTLPTENQGNLYSPMQTMTQQMPQQLPQQVPQQIPQQVPTQMPQLMPQQIPQQIPPQMPQLMPQQVPQEMSQQMPQQVPQEMLQQMPQSPTINQADGVLQHQSEPKKSEPINEKPKTFKPTNVMGDYKCSDFPNLFIGPFRYSAPIQRKPFTINNTGAPNSSKKSQMGISKTTKRWELRGGKYCGSFSSRTNGLQELSSKTKCKINPQDRRK